MSDEYDIGYKKPPVTTRFQPGQSGNRKGRPKGARNFVTVMQDELATRIMVTENGKPRKISKQEAIVKQLVNKAISGDPRAIPILLNAMRAYEDQASAAQSDPDVLREEDEAILSRYAKSEEPGL